MSTKFGKLKKKKQGFKVSVIGWIWISILILSVAAYIWTGGSTSILE